MFDYFKPSKLFILVSLFSIPIFAQGDVSISEGKNIKTYWSDIKFMAEIGAQSETEISKQFDKETQAILSAGVSFPLPYNFSAGFFASSTPDFDSSKETNRDEDIKDADGKDIRLVERSVSHGFEEGIAFKYLLEYRKKLGNKHTLIPYVGFFRTEGTVESKRFDMTDRDEPILFSKHNRYYLNSNSDFERKTTFIGVKYLLKKSFYFSAEYGLSTLVIKNTKRSIETSGEEIAFDDSAFDFERYGQGQKLKDNILSIGVGYFF